jgi:glycerol-1-phosphate dehydrogenase [NAD(P)+]
MGTASTWEERTARIAQIGSGRCACGREHPLPAVQIEISGGALERLPALLRGLGVFKPYLVMDGNTRQAAGIRAMRLLNASGFFLQTCCLCTVPGPQADMETLEILARSMDGGCDFILGVGSGVINDLCKMLGQQAGLRTGIVATAPSMDGYCSNSSAMIVSGVKTTIYNQTPALVVCDLEILQSAPADMRGAGIGDMAAKAISIAEWRISRLVTGEYYCETIADEMLAACWQAVDGAAAVLHGEEQAVRGLTEGLLLSGIASSMAQVSRPASGSEHTISHLMDMFAIRRGLPHNLHGVQVGYGVRVALAAYEALLRTDGLPRPAARPFDESRWERDMRRVFGPQADGLIADARREQRNAPETVRARAANAAAHRDEIRAIVQGVVDQKERILAALDAAGIPPLHAPQPLGLSPQDALDIFIHAKDLRARYIFPSLVSDLGLLPWMRDALLPALGLAEDRVRYFDESEG